MSVSVMGCPKAWHMPLPFSSSLAMKRNPLILLSLLICCRGAGAQPKFAFEPHSTWKIADHWAFLVAPEGEKVEGKPLSYLIRVGVSQPDSRGRLDCWRVSFLGWKNVPPKFGVDCEVLIDKDAGFPRQARKGQKREPIKIEKLGSATLITEPVPGWPLEFFPLLEGELKAEDSSISWQFTRVEKGEQIIITAVFNEFEKEKFRVRQTWVRGEKWWREFERHVGGKKNLFARRITDAAELDHLAKTIEPPKDMRWPSGDPFYLRGDKRLHVYLEAGGKQLPIDGLLKQLAKATGLTLTLADNLKNHQPDWELQTNKYRAWQIMELLQSIAMENGLWKRNAAGYELVGVSKRLVSVPNGDQGVSKGESIPPRRDDSLLYFIVAGVGIFILCLYLIRRPFRKGGPA